MKQVVYTRPAASALRKHRSQAARIMEKIERHAETRAGDVKQLHGSTGLRLRVGGYRVIFEETETALTVTAIGPRGGIYD